MSHRSTTRSTTRSTARAVARSLTAVAALALVGTVSACSSTSEKVVEDMAKPVAAHKGEWTEADLRTAAGEYANKIETVTLDEDGSGGVLVLNDGGHDKGESYTDTESYRSNGKTKHRTVTKHYDEWERDCVKVTVSGTKVTAEDYTRESTTEAVTCAD